MKVVVDTNIVFSAVLNTNSQIASILINPKTTIRFYSTDGLLRELESNSEKLLKLSGYTEQELRDLIRFVSAKIRFINTRFIPKPAYHKALNLTKEIDLDDTEFVALAVHLNARFWSGDKRLLKGLDSKNWSNAITTRELFKAIEREA